MVQAAFCGKGTHPRSSFTDTYSKDGKRVACKLCRRERESEYRKAGIAIRSSPDFTITDREFIKAFWSKVKIESFDGCWEWQGALSFHGYGRVQSTKVLGRGSLSAHRISWIITFGWIDPMLSILHRCDNRKCVKPTHLFLGTQHENVLDMVSKGRHWKQRRARGA